jgi:hypothetical protein
MERNRTTKERMVVGYPSCSASFPFFERSSRRRYAADGGVLNTDTRLHFCSASCANDLLPASPGAVFVLRVHCDVPLSHGPEIVRMAKSRGPSSIYVHHRFAENLPVSQIMPSRRHLMVRHPLHETQGGQNLTVRCPMASRGFEELQRLVHVIFPSIAATIEAATRDVHRLRRLHLRNQEESPMTSHSEVSCTALHEALLARSQTTGIKRNGYFYSEISPYIVEVLPDGLCFFLLGSPRSQLRSPLSSAGDNATVVKKCLQLVIVSADFSSSTDAWTVRSKRVEWEVKASALYPNVASASNEDCASGGRKFRTTTHPTLILSGKSDDVTIASKGRTGHGGARSSMGNAHVPSAAKQMHFKTEYSCLAREICATFLSSPSTGKQSTAFKRPAVISALLSWTPFRRRSAALFPDSWQGSKTHLNEVRGLPGGNGHSTRSLTLTLAVDEVEGHRYSATGYRGAASKDRGRSIPKPPSAALPSISKLAAERMVSVHGTRSVDPQELLLDGSRKTSLWPSTGRPGSEYFDFFLQALGDCPIHISLVEELLERIFGSNNMGGSAAAQGRRNDTRGEGPLKSQVAQFWDAIYHRMDQMTEMSYPSPVRMLDVSPVLEIVLHALDYSDLRRAFIATDGPRWLNSVHMASGGLLAYNSPSLASADAIADRASIRDENLTVDGDGKSTRKVSYAGQQSPEVGCERADVLIGCLIRGSPFIVASILGIGTLEDGHLKEDNTAGRHLNSSLLATRTVLLELCHVDVERTEGGVFSAAVANMEAIVHRCFDTLVTIIPSSLSTNSTNAPDDTSKVIYGAAPSIPASSYFPGAESAVVVEAVVSVLCTNQARALLGIMQPVDTGPTPSASLMKKLEYLLGSLAFHELRGHSCRSSHSVAAGNALVRHVLNRCAKLQESECKVRVLQERRTVWEKLKSLEGVVAPNSAQRQGWVRHLCCCALERSL